MAKRTSLGDREKRPVDKLFTSTSEPLDIETKLTNENNKLSKQENNENKKQVNNNTEKQINNKTSKQTNKKSDIEYIRQTYYLTDSLIDSLSVYSTFEKLDKSEIVRKALDKYIPKKYKDMAKQIKNKIIITCKHKNN